MILEAHNIGVGGCFVMHFDPAEMKEQFNIPDNIKPVVLLVFGYPSETAAPLKLHSEFRPMDEVVVYDEF
jgi:nitroreductase